MVEYEKGKIVEELPKEDPGTIYGLTLAEKVQWEVEPDEEKEAAEVVEEVKQIVALVSEGGGEIVRSVALDVVVFHVVVIVAVPCVAHQWIGDVGKVHVE